MRGGGANLDTKNRVESMRSRHRPTASAGSALTMTETLYQRPGDEGSGSHIRGDVSIGSVETQIYAPRNSVLGENRTLTCPRLPPREARKEENSITDLLPAENSRPSSGKELFLEPAAEILERPMTPTPYSVLRKVSEVSEPDSSNHSSGHDSQQPNTGSENQGTTQQPSVAHTPQGLAEHGRSLDDASAKGSVNDSNVAHATPVKRDEEGRVLSRVHPVSRQSVPRSEPDRVPYAVASSSVQADCGGSDGGDAGTTAHEGIVILNSLDATESAAKTGNLTRNNSIFSRRPTTLQSEIPDLESLRLGPRIRHNRLPQSPSMAVNAGRSVPKSTRELWGALGRSRKMMLVSAVLLVLFILNAVASVTAVVVTSVEHRDAGVGLVAWAAVSGVLVLAFGGMLAISFLQYRKMSKDLVSGESWIEMHLRSRPLPARPQSEQRKQDNGATEAWQKFVQDHSQLRRYVEFLESRIGVLEEGRPNAGGRDDGSNTDATGVGNDTSGKREHGVGQASGTDLGDNVGDNTPKARVLNVGSSLSRRQLLQPRIPSPGRAATVPVRSPNLTRRRAFSPSSAKLSPKGTAHYPSRCPRGRLRFSKPPTTTRHQLRRGPSLFATLLLLVEPFFISAMCVRLTPRGAKMEHI